jgi:hypothetical protein
VNKTLVSKISSLMDLIKNRTSESALMKPRFGSMEIYETELTLILNIKMDLNSFVKVKSLILSRLLNVISLCEKLLGIFRVSYYLVSNPIENC